MQIAGDTPLNNRIVTTLMRTSIDLCWLLPASYLMGFSLYGEGAMIDGATVLIALYVPAIVAAVLWHLGVDSPRRTTLGVICFSSVWIGAIWWLHNREAFDAGLFQVFQAEHFPLALATLIYLGVLVYRAVAASIRPDAHMITANAVRGCGLTALMLLMLKYNADWYPVWPVLLLPLALVGSSVAARASLITPTAGETRLGWRGRWAIIALLVMLPLGATLLLVSLSAPGFWAAVGSALYSAWSVITEIIVFIIYPFVYIIYLAYNLLARFVPEEGETPELDMAGPPDMGEYGPVGESPLAAALLIALRIAGLLIVVGGLIWAFQRLRAPTLEDDDGDYSEERISLWDPEAFGRRIRELLSPGKDPATARVSARTATEQKVRALYREMVMTAQPVYRSTPFQTPRVFCNHLVQKARFLSQVTESQIYRLLHLYEAARYGAPREDEQMQKDAEEAMDLLRKQDWKAVSRRDR